MTHALDKRLTMAITRMRGYPELIMDSNIDPYYSYRCKFDTGIMAVIDGFCTLYGLSSRQISVVDHTLMYLQTMLDEETSMVGVAVHIGPVAQKTGVAGIRMRRCGKHCVVSIYGQPGRWMADEVAKKEGFSVPYGYDSDDTHLWCPDCMRDFKINQWKEMS